MTEAVRLTYQQIRDELRPYKFDPTINFCDQARAYIELLLRWNRHMSLTGVTDLDDILRFHFGESLFAISIAGIRGGRLADVGSGAGFPGVPLAMALPAVDLTVIESNTKKAAFLAELERSLELKNMHVYHGRAETLEAAQVFDLVLARAVGSYRDLLEWAGTRLTASGRVLFWLGAQQAREMRACAGWHWQDPVPIPRAEARFIVAGSLSG